VGTLPVGKDLVEITVTATLLSSDVNSLVTNQACATTSTLDAATDKAGVSYCGTSKTGETQEADLAITDTAETSPAVAGEQETFDMTVTNNGPSDAADVKVVNTLPAGTTFVSCSGSAPNTACTDPNEVVTFTTAGLTARSAATATNPHPNQETFKVTVLVSSALTDQSLTDTAVVSSTTPDPVLSNNQAQAAVPMEQDAELSLLKTAAPAQVVAGGKETYTLTVTNHGPSDAHNVVVTDNLPKGLQFLSSGAGCTAVGQTVTCTATSLSAATGANTITFTIVTKVLSTDLGSLANQASVTSGTHDPMLSDNGSAVSIPLSATADLSLVKTAAKARVPVGGEETYSLTVINHGPSSAAKVKVKDSLPAGLTLVAASKGCTHTAQTVTCTIATLGATAPANTVTFKVVALVGPKAKAALTNRATVSSATSDSSTRNNTGTATIRVLAPVLKLTKVASQKIVANGAAAGYVLTLANVGKGLASNVKVCDTLPAGTTLIKATGAHLLNGSVCWTIRRLAGGHRLKLGLTLKMAASTLSGKVVNHATASADGAVTRRAAAGIEVTPGNGPRADGVTG
jgi:uncharacterized repeat protein (TIGR01451 family)